MPTELYVAQDGVLFVVEHKIGGRWVAQPDRATRYREVAERDVKLHHSPRDQWRVMPYRRDEEAKAAEP